MLTMATGAEGLASLRPVGGHALLTARVEDALREAILTGELRPGTRLSVPQVASLLGVSRTPAREALFALERDGLVDISPRKGAIVLQAGLDDLLELYDLREALDGMAARFAAIRATDDDRASLADLIARYEEAVGLGASDEYVTLDFAFHRAVLEMASSRRLSEALARIHNQVQVAGRALAMQDWIALPSVLAEHAAIGAAITAGKPDAAEEAARAHVRHIRADAHEFYSGARAQEDGSGP